jgi:peptidyl-prolyl cis-trans isomerase C
MFDMKLATCAALVAMFGVAAHTYGQTATNTASATADRVAQLFPDEVVAKGKGVEVKRAQLDEEVIRIKAQLAAAGQPIPAAHLKMVEQNILDQMITLQLLKAKATDADRAAGKAVAEKRFAAAKERLGSDDAIKMRLKAEGLTEEQLIGKWTDQATAEAVVKRELNVNITDEDVKKYYDENPARFEQPESVRASHILFSTRDSATQQELPEDKKAAKRKEAEEVLKRARAGEDFAKLAKEFSEDPGSKDNGGEYTFPRGRMVPEFEAAAFALSPGQIADIVTTQFGYHIIKLSEKIPAKKIELEKVAADVKEGLTQQSVQKQLPDYVKQLRKDAGVEVLDESLKPKETVDASGLPAGHPTVQPAPKTADGLPVGHPPVGDAKK